MTAANAYEALTAHARETGLLATTSALLAWDQETYMPKGAGDVRARQLAMLAGLQHERATDARVAEWLAACEADAELLQDGDRAANVRDLRTDFDRATRLPRALVAELAATESRAQQAWADARAAANFHKFRPWLERLVGLQQQKADCLKRPGQSRWDALADLYEPGMCAADLKALFGPLRERLVALRQRLCTGRAPDDAFARVAIDEPRQEAFVRAVVLAMGFDFTRGRIDRSAHPFCTSTGGDVRLTTRFHKDNVLDALGSTMHEGGHGLYEQGLDPAHFGTPLGEAVSLGVHESQSRLWENHVGRSAAFWQWCWPIAQQHLGAACEGHTAASVHRAANLVQPSLIRVEADEATYDLHVMVRFELEQALIDGELGVSNLPGHWNALYRDYLGLQVPDDRSGCLQDVHWSCGLFGYFPTYTLGNLYAAQFAAAADKALGGLAPLLARGEFAPLREWLRRHVHQHGRRYRPAELCKRVTGAPLSSEPFLAYLDAKLSSVYALVTWFLLCIGLCAQQRVSLDGPWQVQSLDAASSREIQVPAAAETALGIPFDGVAVYRRRLPLPAARVQRVRIEFAAVATHATVCCNGTELAQHLGGWTPFRVDVTEALRWNGEDELVVRVDEKVGHNTQGFLPIIEPHFGGIWQGVTLCLDDGPVLDRLGLFTFGKRGTLLYAIPTLGPSTGPLAAVLRVTDGEHTLATTRVELEAGLASSGELAVPDAGTWSPLTPKLYTVHVELQSEGRTVDALERKVGFRDLRADGTRVLWNGQALQVRGILHWGYSPPHLAPPTDPAFWRRQLEDFRSLGFNCLKCCLWVPPTCVYDLCDELGLLVWQEYPTWHPQMDQAHKQELLAEYAEFFVHDRWHPSVAFRSITCETGQGAELDVVTSLFSACKAAVPDTLVVDDSSWIGWQRITDFWDEHPYGNNRWWPGRLGEFLQHIASKGQKPLLLGECIAADTWADRARWLAQHGDEPVWWRPDCFADQARFEAWVTQQFGEPTLASLGPVSRDYAMRTRRYQIERLRMAIPDAGYVVSVARDFAKARMGIYDDFDQLKWSAADWSWQRDTMLCLDTPGDARAFVVAPGQQPALAVRLVRSNSPMPLVGVGGSTGGPSFANEVSAPLPLHGAPDHVERPTRQHLECRAAAGPKAQDTDPAIAASLGLDHPGWDVWFLPPFDDARPADVLVRDQLDPTTLTELENGARVLLRVAGQPRSVRSEAKWYLTGAPFAPPHPVHDRLPAEMLIELQPFDLDGGRLMPWAPWLDQVDAMLAFWETHDIGEVRAHLFAFDTNVGKGRLVASAFDCETPAGRYVEHELLHHLAEGPAPKHSLTAATIASLHAALTEQKIDLPVWRFRTDPQNEGRAGNWQDPKTDVAGSAWRDLKAGSHWENQAEDLRQYTGVAWYRIDVDVPASWQGLAARAVFEGVDDSFEFWLDGEPVGTFGDEATKTSIWLERQVAELGQRLAPGPHTLVLRVVDHAGAGGLWKPAFLTTGPADAGTRYLQAEQ